MLDPTQTWLTDEERATLDHQEGAEDDRDGLCLPELDREMDRPLTGFLASMLMDANRGVQLANRKWRGR